MKKILSLLSVTVFFGLNAQNVKNVDANTFKSLIEEKKGVLIDLRTDDELLRKGKIKDAIQLDYFAKDAEARISKLDKHKVYLIYCAGGGRSSECADLMLKNGFKDVVNLQAGFDDWKRKGLPIETVAK